MRDSRTKTTLQSKTAYATFNEAIYLNALPHFIHRIDITEVDQKGDLFAYSFIENILKGQAFEMEITPSFHTAEKLRHLYFESRNKERLKGPKSFGFGYPFYVAHQDSFLAVAPVFIWNLNLEPAANNTEVWKLSAKETPRARLNPALLDLWEKKNEDFKLSFEHEVLRGDEMLNLLNELAEKTGIEESFQHIAICPSPTIKELDSVPINGAIHWTGVLGLYPPHISDDTVEIPPKLFQPQLIPGDGHEFGLLQTDPYQASALKSVFRNKLTLIEGESGTGKTHLLLHLLTNILLNGEKCLLVSESVPALRETQLNLSDLGINQFHFLLRDEIQDNILFQELLRAALADAPDVDYDKDQLRVLLDKAERQKARLDENFRALNKNVFGAANWTETVGRFLKNNRQEGKELLGSQLNNPDFLFSIEEFNYLKNCIETSHPLYQKINTLRHPLQNLNEAIFKDLNKTDGLVFIQQQTNLFSEKATRLQQRYINKQNDYADALINHYDEVYKEQADLLNTLREKIKDYSNQFGDLYRETGKGMLRFYGLFSSRYKAAFQAKEETARLLEELHREYKAKAYFDFSFSIRAQDKHIGKIEKELEEFGLELESWRNSHSALVQEETGRLSSKNVHYKLDHREQIEELEFALDNLLNEINEAQLYQQVLENKMLTIPKRQKYLEEVIEQLENTRFFLRDYDAFYDWQRNWLNLSEKAKKVVKALIKVKPNNWIVAFESWYLNNILNNNYDPALLPDMEMVEDFHRNDVNLRRLLKAYLLEFSQTRQDTAIKALRRKDKASYNLLFGKKKEGAGYEALKALFDAGLKTISEVLPILMMPPDVAMALMPEADGVFDYIILDEAQIIPLEKAPALFRLGKKQVLFGNANQLGEEDFSILGEALAMGVRSYKLQHFHQFNPANLFQSQEREIFEDQTRELKVHFAQADGRYNPEEETNDVEAQYIIRLLNQVNKTPQRTFPAVGIATFTTRQRDLIADYLLKIKQKRTPGFEKIQQLERNGLGIFCIDELSGQHFDILFVSGTFGLIDSKGTATDAKQWLDEGLGKALINLLMGRPLRELFIVNSIPLEELEEMSGKKEAEGSFLLANYFLYARTCELNSGKTRKKTLDRVAKWLDKNTLPEPTFTYREELIHAMKPYLEPGRIQTEPPKGLSTKPVLVKGLTEDRPAILLWPDGFASDTYATDFRWEFEQILQLKQKGLIHIPVWTANWWRNPEKEVRRLASAIIKIDSEEILLDEEQVN